MKLNFKVILLGGLAFYVVQFIVSMITGPFIHEGVLVEPYTATVTFWRPELTTVPPDMAALMPRWIATGLIGTFILTGIFDNIRPALDGAAWLKGVKFGIIAFLFTACLYAGLSGVFNLPNAIWMWWAVESLFIYAVSGAVLGWVTGKLSPE